MFWFKRYIKDLGVYLFRSCNLCMLFKIIKLVCQESRRQNPSSRAPREFYLSAKLTGIIDYS